MKWHRAEMLRVRHSVVDPQPQERWPTRKSKTALRYFNAQTDADRVDQMDAIRRNPFTIAKGWNP